MPTFSMPCEHDFVWYGNDVPRRCSKCGATQTGQPLPPGVDRPRYEAAPVSMKAWQRLRPMGAYGKLGGASGMYEGTEHQKADPERMRAVLSDEFGPIIGSKVHPMIPINVAQDAPQQETKFDADVLAIMLREAGATYGGLFPVYKDKVWLLDDAALQRLAEALNNLGS